MITGTQLFVLIVLAVLAALFICAAVLGITIVVMSFVDDHRHKQETSKRREALGLQEEQRRAVAIAQALVIQHFYDNNNGSGQGACV